MSSSQLAERINELLVSAEKKIYLRDSDGAIEDLRAAEVLDSANPVVLYNLAAAYAKDGLHRTAIEYADKVLSLPSAFVDAMKVRRMKAYSLSMLNRYGEAELILKEIIAAVPADSCALSMLGFVYEKTDRVKDAVDCYRRAVSFEKANATSLNSLAYIMAKSGGDMNGALQLAKKALDADPENPAYLDILGYIYMKRGENDMARKYIKKAYEKLPANEEIKQHLNELLRL